MGSYNERNRARLVNFILDSNLLPHFSLLPRIHLYRNKQKSKHFNHLNCSSAYFYQRHSILQRQHLKQKHAIDPQRHGFLLHVRQIQFHPRIRYVEHKQPRESQKLSFIQLYFSPSFERKSFILFEFSLFLGLQQ